MSELFSSKNNKKYNTQGRASQLNELNRTSEDTQLDNIRIKYKDRKSTLNVRPDEEDLLNNNNNLLQSIRARKST